MATEVHFKEKFNKVFEHLAQVGKQVVDDDIRSLMFGDYMANKDEERLYNEIKDLDLLREVRKFLHRLGHGSGDSSVSSIVTQIAFS